MSDIVNEYTLFFNTIYREPTTTTDYPNFQLARPLILTTQNNNFEVGLINLTVPFAWHQLRAPNNTITYQFNSTTTTLTINDASYTILTLLSTIQKALNGIYTSSTFNFTFNTDTQYCTFALTSSTITSFTIFFNSNQLLCRMLGFQSNITFTNSSTTTSTQQVNVSQVKNLFFRCDNMITSSNYESISSKSVQSDILEVIPIMVGINNYINFTPNNINYNKITNNVISNVSVYLSDDESIFGDSIPLLLNWTFALKIRERHSKLNGILPDSNPLNKPITNAIENVLNPEQQNLLTLREKLNKQIEDIKRKKGI